MENYGALVRITLVDPVYHQKHPHYLHTHEDELELLYIRSGSGKYVVNGKVYNVKEGDLIVCDANVLHGEMPDQQNVMDSLCCIYKGTKFGELPLNTLTPEGEDPVISLMNHPIRMEATKAIVRTIFLLANDEKKDDELWQIMGRALIKQAIHLFDMRREEEKGPAKLNKKSGHDDLIYEIVKDLNKNYRSFISLQELSDKYHINKFYLSHAFNDLIGISVMRYVNCLRLGEAQSLLINTELSISEISERLGYDDNTYFCSLFRKKIGLSPSNYRRYFRKQNEDPMRRGSV